MKKIFLIIIPLLILGLIWMVFFWSPKKTPSNFNGHTAIEANKAVTKNTQFQLKSSSGEVSLNDFSGKVVLIYFGYTWCPDICPTNLSMMSGALSQLSPKESTQVQGIFISVDPDRDSVERLKEYTKFFHSNIIGLTGSKQQIDDLAQRYGVAFRLVKQDSATDYVVDHSSETYVIGKDGTLVEKLPHAALPEQILTAIRKNL